MDSGSLLNSPVSTNIAPRPAHVTSIAVREPGAEVRPQDPKRKRIACQECRQGKVCLGLLSLESLWLTNDFQLRCEGTNRQSCKRCSSLGLTCVYDNDYKRYNKRL